MKINSASPLYLILNKINGYFKEINGNKYSKLVPKNETKKEKENKTKKYEERRIKIRDLIRLVTSNSIQMVNYI